MRLVGDIEGWIQPHTILRVTDDTLLVEEWMYKGRRLDNGTFHVDLKASGFFDDPNTPF